MTGKPRPGPECISRNGSATTSTRFFAAALARPPCNACTNSKSASRRRIRSVRYGRNTWIVVELPANIEPFGDQAQFRGRQVASVIEYGVMETTVKHPKESCRTSGAAGGHRRRQRDWHHDGGRRAGHRVRRSGRRHQQVLQHAHIKRLCIMCKEKLFV